MERTHKPNLSDIIRHVTLLYQRKILMTESKLNLGPLESLFLRILRLYPSGFIWWTDTLVIHHMAEIWTKIMTLDSYRFILLESSQSLVLPRFSFGPSFFIHISGRFRGRINLFTWVPNGHIYVAYHFFWKIRNHTNSDQEINACSCFERL